MNAAKWPMDLFPYPTDFVRLSCCLSSILENLELYERTLDVKHFALLASHVRMLEVLEVGSSSLVEFDVYDFEVRGWDDRILKDLEHLSLVYRELVEVIQEWEEGNNVSIGRSDFLTCFEAQSIKLFGVVLPLSTDGTNASDTFAMEELCEKLRINEQADNRNAKTLSTPRTLFREDLDDRLSITLRCFLGSFIDDSATVNRVQAGLTRRIPLKDCCDLPIEDPFEKLERIEVLACFRAANNANPISFCKAWDAYHESKRFAERELSFVQWLRETTELSFDATNPTNHQTVIPASSVNLLSRSSCSVFSECLSVLTGGNTERLPSKPNSINEVNATVAVGKAHSKSYPATVTQQVNNQPRIVAARKDGEPINAPIQWVSVSEIKDLFKTRDGQKPSTASLRRWIKDSGLLAKPNQSPTQYEWEDVRRLMDEKRYLLEIDKATKRKLYVAQNESN